VVQGRVGRPEDVQRVWAQKRKRKFQTPLPVMPSKGSSQEDDSGRKEIKHNTQDWTRKNQT